MRCQDASKQCEGVGGEVGNELDELDKGQKLERLMTYIARQDKRLQQQ